MEPRLTRHAAPPSGEQIFEWMWEDYAGLVPLKRVADLIAQCDAWGPLYDPEVLRNIKVPCSAVICELVGSLSSWT
jgi:hypothetical protein